MHVLISGASVAGPALAYWLNRYGIRTTIVERTPELRTGRYLATMPKEIFAGDLEVPMSDLTRILYDLTEADTEYVFGDSITALTQDDGAVRVDFERATSKTYDR